MTDGQAHSEAALLCIRITCPCDNRDYINPANGRPIYRPIKCQILALFFIGRQKINHNYLVIIFPSADSFGVLAIGRRLADKSADVIFE